MGSGVPISTTYPMEAVGIFGCSRFEIKSPLEPLRLQSQHGCVGSGTPQVIYSSSPYVMPGAASISAMPMTSYTTTPAAYSALVSGELF